MAKKIKNIEWWRTPSSCQECYMRGIDMALELTTDIKVEIAKAFRIIREQKSENFRANLKTMNI